MGDYGLKTKNVKQYTLVQFCQGKKSKVKSECDDFTRKGSYKVVKKTQK